jgi:glycosyltransferase involved in cell wall biosynthesis
MSILQPTSPNLTGELESEELVVSVVIPCLNEEANIEKCVTLALAVMEEHQIPGEVVVADNASEDRSA